LVAESYRGRKKKKEKEIERVRESPLSFLSCALHPLLHSLMCVCVCVCVCFCHNFSTTPQTAIIGSLMTSIALLSIKTWHNVHLYVFEIH
jgi:hypothetical protein